MSAGTEDNFVADDNIFRADPDDYPVFAVKQDMDAPLGNVIPPLSDGMERPALKRDYRWEVTHVVKGRYLIGSQEYDAERCMIEFYADSKRIRRGDCDSLNPKAKGGSYVLRIYINPDNHAYGWEALKNQRRWFFREKLTRFKLDNTGDWSGQPWFECIERCEKLANMTNYFDDTGTGLKAKYPVLYKRFIEFVEKNPAKPRE